MVGQGEAGRDKTGKSREGKMEMLGKERRGRVERAVNDFKG